MSLMFRKKVRDVDKGCRYGFVSRGISIVERIERITSCYLCVFWGKVCVHVCK